MNIGYILEKFILFPLIAKQKEKSIKRRFMVQFVL